MARRGRLSVEAVLDEIEQDDFDFFDDDEPMMPGSEDKFSDLDDEDDADDADSDDADDDTCHSPLQPPPSNTAGSSSDTLPCWSSTLTPVAVPSFTSHVGPKVAIPESPSEVFQLMFTPALLDSIVEQSNLYAKEVMGEDKYSS